MFLMSHTVKIISKTFNKTLANNKTLQVLIKTNVFSKINNN